MPDRSKEQREQAKAFEKEIQAYTERVADEKREAPLTEEQVKEMDGKIANWSSYYPNEAFSLARDRVYSQFESVPPLLKNYLGIKRVNEFLQKCGSADVSEPQVQQFLQDNVMDAAFRAGISMARQQGTIEAREFEQCERFMNRYMMEKTLGPISKTEKAEARNALNSKNPQKPMTDDEFDRFLVGNMEKRIMVAKLLLMGQLGRFDEKKENGKTKPYENTMAEAFSHGGRTKFALPYSKTKQGKKEQNELMEAVMPQKPIPAGGDAELKSRTAATHYVSAQKMNGQGDVVSEMKEDRPRVNLVKIMSKQYGMNVAVGGLGKKGPNQETILPDGQNGHMYMRAEKGGYHTCGSLLVGFENAEPGQTGRLGASHGMKAKSAGQSAFVTDKNVPGAVIDGRTVDLSGISPENFTRFMKQFDFWYGIKLKEADYEYSNPEEHKLHKQKLEDFNHLLCGERLETDKLMDALKDIGMDADLVTQVVQAGRSIENKKNYTLPREKVQPITDGSAERWNTDLTGKLFDKIGLDMSDRKQWERLQVMEDCNGVWKLTPLFDADKHATPQARYNRFRTLVNEGKELYAYGRGEMMPCKIEMNKQTLEVSVSDQIAAIQSPEPKKPSIVKRALNKISFGLIYKQTMKEYKKEKKVYEREMQKHTALENKRQERSAGPAQQEQREWRAARESAERARSASVSVPSSQRSTSPARRERSHSLGHSPAKSGPVK